MTPDELRAQKISGAEIAVFDACEQAVFSAEHLFWGSCVPLSQLELVVGDLVPRRSCPAVWVDADSAPGGPAEQAFQRMRELAWTDVSVLDGGVSAWAGGRYSGVNVPSIAFGEGTERADRTPHITATELARRQAPAKRW